MFNRNLRQEAEAFCGLGQLVAIRENRVAARDHKIPAWNVFIKDVGAKRGKVVFTLVDLQNMYYA